MNSGMLACLAFAVDCLCHGEGDLEKEGSADAAAEEEEEDEETGAEQAANAY